MMLVASAINWFLYIHIIFFLSFILRYYAVLLANIIHVLPCKCIHYKIYLSINMIDISLKGE